MAALRVTGCSWTQVTGFALSTEWWWLPVVHASAPDLACVVRNKRVWSRGQHLCPSPVPTVWAQLCRGSSPLTEKVAGMNANEFACRTACAACRGQAVGLQGLAFLPRLATRSQCTAGEPPWAPHTCAQGCPVSRRFVAHREASQITCHTPETAFGHHWMTCGCPSCSWRVLVSSMPRGVQQLLLPLPGLPLAPQRQQLAGGKGARAGQGK